MGILSGLAALLSVVLYALIAHRLRNVHPSEWEQLGGPKTLYDPTELSSLNLADFVWKGAWIRLHDFELRILCVAFYLAVAVMVVSFVVAIVFQ